MTSDKPALTASTEWPERVYELQKTDPVDAGADGIDNLAPNQLAARTNYLRVKGISDWAAVWNYPDGAFCQVAGVVYRAVTANAGKPPASNPAIWTRCPMTAAEIADAINLSDKQPVDATLTALAGLNTSADRLIYATGADQFALTPLTAFIRTLLDDADAATARATLGAAPLASPALTDTPTAPTAATGTNTTQIATTAFVNAEIAAGRPFEATLANIKMDGAQSVGSLNTVARGDHVHPTDTSRAPLASPALTGIPTAPTASTGTRSTQLATTAFVGAESQIAAPTGSVYTFAGSTVPTGWLKCNGALLSRTTYAALFAVIGTTYGAGDGSTTFALPDLRGEFVRGADDARGVDAGRALGAWQNHSMQRHNHYLPTSSGGGNSHFVIPDGAWGISTPNEYPSSNMAPAVTINADNNANSASGNAGNFSSETVPRNVAMHYIIKY